MTDFDAEQPRKRRKNARVKRASAETVALGQYLAICRDDRGLTQKQLAKRIKWLPGQVARVECAHHEFSIKTLRTYLDGLDMTIELKSRSA